MKTTFILSNQDYWLHRDSWQQPSHCFY